MVYSRSRKKSRGYFKKYDSKRTPDLYRRYRLDVHPRYSPIKCSGYKNVRRTAGRRYMGSFHGLSLRSFTGSHMESGYGLCVRRSFGTRLQGSWSKHSIRSCRKHRKSPFLWPELRIYGRRPFLDGNDFYRIYQGITRKRSDGSDQTLHGQLPRI